MKNLIRTLIVAVLFCAATFSPSASASTGVAVVGAKVTISVTADGTQPFTYQWFKGTAPIAGATNATLIFDPFTAANVGTYHVVVSNAAGSATSDDAVLSAIVGPANVVTGIVVTQNGVTTVYPVK